MLTEEAQKNLSNKIAKEIGAKIIMMLAFKFPRPLSVLQSNDENTPFVTPDKTTTTADIGTHTTKHFF
jgi:hypothetical protein